MSVAFDAVGAAQSGVGGTATSISITLGSGPNTAVVVGFTGSVDTTGFACSMAGGAEVFTLISGTDGGGTTGTVMFGKATSLTGAQTIGCSWTNGQDFGVDAISFTGVNQATPFNNGTFTSGASPLGISVTSANGDLTTTVVEVSASAATNRTLEWITLGDTRAGDIGPGTGTTTHTWTATGSVFGSGANVVQAGGAETELMESRQMISLPPAIFA